MNCVISSDALFRKSAQKYNKHFLEKSAQKYNKHFLEKSAQKYNKHFLEKSAQKYNKHFFLGLAETALRKNLAISLWPIARPR